MDSQSGYADDPPPTSVPYFSIENVADRVPHAYLGLMIATGSSSYDAVDALEKRALDTARREHAQLGESAQAAIRGPGRHGYAVIGLRIAAGTSPSGQPEWVAYGTLVQLRYEGRPDEIPGA